MEEKSSEEIKMIKVVGTLEVQWCHKDNRVSTETYEVSFDLNRSKKTASMFVAHDGLQEVFRMHPEYHNERAANWFEYKKLTFDGKNVLE